jgi:hypothetical protein
VPVVAPRKVPVVEAWKVLRTVGEASLSSAFFVSMSTLKTQPVADVFMISRTAVSALPPRGIHGP